MNGWNIFNGRKKSKNRCTFNGTTLGLQKLGIDVVPRWKRFVRFERIHTSFDLRVINVSSGSCYECVFCLSFFFFLLTCTLIRWQYRGKNNDILFFQLPIANERTILSRMPQMWPLHCFYIAIRHLIVALHEFVDLYVCVCVAVWERVLFMSISEIYRTRANIAALTLFLFVVIITSSTKKNEMSNVQTCKYNCTQLWLLRFCKSGNKNCWHAKKRGMQNKKSWSFCARQRTMSLLQMHMRRYLKSNAVHLPHTHTRSLGSSQCISYSKSTKLSTAGNGRRKEVRAAASEQKNVHVFLLFEN